MSAFQNFSQSTTLLFGLNQRRNFVRVVGEISYIAKVVAIFISFSTTAIHETLKVKYLIPQSNGGY
jgi:hypothetical protein